MDLTWWIVAIAGCLALALCIVAALSRPVAGRRFRRLANVERITKLPAYVRAVRRRTVATVAALVLLSVGFGCAVVAAARPTGLPTTGRDAASGQPEDVMLCAGAPADDPALTATMRYFAGHVNEFDTQRIGLTSANRRVIPLTRDHQYAATRFAQYGAPVTPQDVAVRQADFAPTATYSDYAQTVDDLLALCLTGFPQFEETGAQRRSVIYVGPAQLPAGDGASLPSLFDADRVRELAEAAGAQVNVLVTGGGGEQLEALAGATGGRFLSADSDVVGPLGEVRDNPPPATPDIGPTVTAAVPESPDLPVVAALLAVAALSVIGVVVRR